ncbi:MAG: SDR family oxidoreductase [Bacteroidales bacterium]|nr:SDR family oxidoreductase [Bacteroidales bacterium]
MNENPFFQDLKGKTCLITGGGGVLGTAIAKGCAMAGINTIILDRNSCVADTLSEEIRREFGTASLSVCADVCDRTTLEKAYEIVLRHFPSIDFLINGAGGNVAGATTAREKAEPEFSPEETFFGLDVNAFRSALDLNFLGTVLPTHVFSREMLTRRQGVILNIASMNAYRPLTRIPAYSAGKAAVVNFTQWLAVHLAPSNIRVNAIAPGFFLTHQNRSLLLKDDGTLTERGDKILGHTPMNRFGKPEDLVGTVLYLLSDMSAFVTGAIIPVDGGFNAYSGV